LDELAQRRQAAGLSRGVFTGSVCDTHRALDHLFNYVTLTTP